MTDREKLEQIEAWMHPGLWSGADGRRAALTRILAGQDAPPPEWARK